MNIPLFLLIVAVWFFANVWAAWQSSPHWIMFPLLLPAYLVTSGLTLVYFAKWWNGVL